MDDLHRSASIAAALSPGRVSARAMRRAAVIVRESDTLTSAPRRCTRCGAPGCRRDRCTAVDPVPPATEAARAVERRELRAQHPERAHLLGVGIIRRADTVCTCPGESEAPALEQVSEWIRTGCRVHDTCRGDRVAARRGRELVERERGGFA